MSSESEAPRNAFTSDFLERLDDLGEPDSAHEADSAGPWQVRSMPYQGQEGFAVLRQWESLEAGDLPCAVFPRRETALLAAAVLPATGREPIFRLATEPDAQGFPLLSVSAAAAAPLHSDDPATAGPCPAAPSAGTRAVSGHLRDFDEGLAAALHIILAVARSPLALAGLLEAAGYVALEQAGRILERRIRARR